jgi:hypothetical protein
VDAARFDLVNREEDYRRVLAMLDAV